MFEDYFMQMLTSTAHQMVHSLSPILAYFFQHFDRYLMNKCFNVVFQCVNADLYMDMDFIIALQNR